MKSLGEIAFDAYQLRWHESERDLWSEATEKDKYQWHLVANEVCLAYEDRSSIVKPCATQKELAIGDTGRGFFTIYTDGSCDPNPGPGGWGFVCVETKFEKCGGHHDTTNNRMEIAAVLGALTHHREVHGLDARLIVFSDSQYVVKACSQWIRKWKSKGWSRGKNELKNVDLWKQIDAAMTGMAVSFKWLRGHVGHVWNERADQLANSGRAANELGARHATS